MDNALHSLIQRHHSEAYLAWDNLNRKYDEIEGYDEPYEDTLTRKYEEGFSDALAMVLRLMKGDN